MSAKNKLLSSIGFLFLLVVFIIVTMSYLSFKNASVKNYTEKLMNNAHLISYAVEQRMERYFDVLTLSGNEINIDSRGHIDEEQLRKTLHNLESNPHILNAFFASTDGVTYRPGGRIAGFNAKDKQREWFKKALNGDQYVITAPFKAITGETVMSLSILIKRHGNIVGVLGVNITLDMITKFIQSLTDNNQLFVSKEDGYIVAASEHQYIGQNLFQIRPSYSRYRDMDGASHFYQYKGKSYYSVNAISEKLGWSVWAWDKKDNIDAASEANLMTDVYITIIAITFSLIVTYFLVVRLMYMPIGGEPKEIEAIIQRVAEGDLTFQVSDISRETGVYAAIMAMVKNLKSIIEGIYGAIDQLNHASVQMLDTTSAVKSSAESQMVQLEQTATAMNEMTVTVDEVARSALQASGAARESGEHSSLGMSVVREMNQSIQDLATGIKAVVDVNTGLEKETQGIGSILEVIDSISEQTNLLALNAAIEAARAGEYGRGFSVVADEVRHLANRTKQSTNEIQDMIVRLQREAQHSVQLMQDNMLDAQTTAKKSEMANQALQEIQNAVSLIQDMNSQIATAAEEQTHVAGEINASVVQINELARNTFDDASGNSGRAGKLAEVASQLHESVKIFKI
ncbi:Methyl-accepting chemotaxis protein PctC [Vibrio aerogenes CECT 7868]|uniref:Methyl-accepting chemotaxis protein PctC n=1 Tax=Vibrio aerogenes CECT 7868 TaxID=1216006 RepID=A0A1M5Y9L6_9VIBR|nr:methyl-accepting chemotaxis protein [Vibrio aerogenes]SHI08781.1 Methyl-accepting chemotaxis protein PctC [Vibrio aerogenes CECT 7868]